MADDLCLLGGQLERGELETPKPGDARLQGLENLTPQPWHLELSSGETLELPPGKRCNLATLRRVQTPLGSISVER